MEGAICFYHSVMPKQVAVSNSVAGNKPATLKTGRNEGEIHLRTQMRAFFHYYHCLRTAAEETENPGDFKTKDAGKEEGTINPILTLVISRRKGLREIFQRGFSRVFRGSFKILQINISVQGSEKLNIAVHDCFRNAIGKHRCFKISRGEGDIF